MLFRGMRTEDVCGSLYGSIKKSRSDNQPQRSLPVAGERECNFERIGRDAGGGGGEEDLLIRCFGMQKKVTGGVTGEEGRCGKGKAGRPPTVIMSRKLLTSKKWL